MFDDESDTREARARKDRARDYVRRHLEDLAPTLPVCELPTGGSLLELFERYLRQLPRKEDSRPRFADVVRQWARFRFEMTVGAVADFLERKKGGLISDDVRITVFPVDPDEIFAERPSEEFLEELRKRYKRVFPK